MSSDHTAARYVEYVRHLDRSGLRRLARISDRDTVASVLEADTTWLEPSHREWALGALDDTLGEFVVRCRTTQHDVRTVDLILCKRRLLLLVAHAPRASFAKKRMDQEIRFHH